MTESAALNFALKQIADSLVETNKSLHALNESLQSVRQDVAVLKSQELHSKYDAIRVELDTLKAEKNQRLGSNGLVNWVFTHIMPWLITAVAIIASLWEASHSKVIK